MARDRGLEELLAENLAGVRGLSKKPMFGGMAWLRHGNLLCGASDRGMMVRLGKNRDSWALRIAGVETMMIRDRPMSGWLIAAASVYADDALRKKLLEAALDYNQSLPPK